MNAKNRDFLDHDLATGEESMDGAENIFAGSGEANIGKLIEQRHQRTNRMANAVHEIQRLRSRQTQLEKEKTGLESLTRTQDTYEEGKREVMIKLEKGIVLLEKQSEETVQAAELLSLVRTRYADALKDLRQIREDEWQPGDFEREITRAMALVEKAQSTHSKGVAKVNASTWLKSSGETRSSRQAAGNESMTPLPGFGHWLQAGIAFSLPLVLVIAACFVVWLFLNGVF